MARLGSRLGAYLGSGLSLPPPFDTLSAEDLRRALDIPDLVAGAALRNASECLGIFGDHGASTLKKW